MYEFLIATNEVVETLLDFCLSLQRLLLVVVTEALYHIVVR